MKTVVSISEINSLELRPSTLLKEWRQLVVDDIKMQWEHKLGWVDVEWPGQSSASVHAFNKNGFDYVERDSCGSLFVPHRPNEDQIWHWYRDSESSIFWRNKMLPTVRSYESATLTEPRVDWILSGLAEHFPEASRFMDVSTYGYETINSILERRPYSQFLSLGITADLEVAASNDSISVKPTRISHLTTEALEADVILAFDILDRAHSLSDLIDALKNNLKIGGLLFANAPVSSGLEIQSLWGDSSLITPPDKLNLPSINALKSIFSAPDWELIELSTPGVLDVDLIMRAMKGGAEDLWPRSLKVLVGGAKEHGADALIELLQSQRLSSYARFIAKRIV
jgi:hypothetical protein